MSVAALLAEFIGVFALCLVGGGAIMTHAHLGDAGPGLVGIALAHGVILSIMVTAFMNVSGGHINPAVTAAMLVTGRISLPGAVAYIISQCAGGFLAGLILFSFIFTDVQTPDGRSVITETKNGTPFYMVEKLGADTRAEPSDDAEQQAATDGRRAAVKAVAIEAILTFFLITAVFGTAVDPRHPNVGGFGIGLTVTADILIGGPLTGAAMNPARALGTGLITMDADVLSQHWVYWVGPILGGVVAGLLYHHLILPKAGAAKAGG